VISPDDDPAFRDDDPAFRDDDPAFRDDDPALRDHESPFADDEPVRSLLLRPTAAARTVAPDDDFVMLVDSLVPPAAESQGRQRNEPSGSPWTVLVVDDEPSIHQVTRLALGGFRADGLPLELLHAQSAAEARSVLKSTPHCALVLLDVVMETDDAGLKLVEWVRSDLRNSTTRIVLRTGQPGIAPEESVMARYDIHDYLTKTEVSAQRLRTAVTGALRAYRDLRALASQRASLEKVIVAMGSLFAPRSTQQLLAAILEQVSGLLSPREPSILFLAPSSLVGEAPEGADDTRIVVATGRFREHQGAPASAVFPPQVLAEIAAARPESWTFVGRDGVFGFDVDGRSLAALVLEGAVGLSDWERWMLALFCVSATMALRNEKQHRSAV
jgi:CheY-like chemotaxis protein